MLISQRKIAIQLIFVIISVFHGSRSQEKPEIIRINSQTVYLNQSATFVCRVKGNLKPFMIQWAQSDRKLLHSVPGSLIVNNGNLTFPHVQRSNDGIYMCIANNSAGTTTAQVTLTVLDPPVAPRINTITQDQTIVEGERVTFTCKASGNPLPQITWKISLDSGLPDSTTQLERPSPESIRISSASPKDTGQYMCIAENDSGNDTDVVLLNVLGYPVFIVSPPSNITVQENNTVRLNCVVVGSPKADVIWYYGDTQADQISNIVVLNNNTLQISDVKFNNRGDYKCMANNSAGLQRSKSTLLQVFRAPSLDCCPSKLTVWQNQTAIEEEATSLNCSATGYPELAYEWMLKNNIIASFSIFSISNVSRRNEGVYSCKAHNNLGEVLLMINLKVLVPPAVAVEPQQITVVEGKRVEFLCSATGVPLPAITWYPPRGGLLRNNTLIITNVSRNDQGVYFCEAKNEAGQRTVRARFTVAVRPTFVTLPRNITFNETSSVSIRCTAKGPDEPIISWYRLTMNGQRKNLSRSGNMLAITNVNRTDTGQYTCEARNYAGYINTTFFINVQYRPYVLLSKRAVSIVEAKPAILYCPIYANPAAMIEWINPVSSGTTFVIAKVDTSDGGQYSCRGTNILGASEATLQVQVLTPPRIVDLKMVEKFNNFVSLTCVTMGKPKAVINWIDLTPLPSGSFNIHEGSLQIEKKRIDTMEFICNASNAYGWMIKYVTVPSTPHEFNITKILSSSITFSWLADDTEVITSFIVERRSTSDLDWITVNSSVTFLWFKDQNLTPFTTFMYRVSARNVLGRSKPSVSLNISTREGVPSSPSSLKAKSFSLTSITVYWKPPITTRGQLTNIVYEIYYKENVLALPQSEMKITINSTVKYQVRIQQLNSNTLYIIKIRAGRHSDGSLQWSDYGRIHAKTLQKAPTAAPKKINVASNGPRRLYVTWERSPSYVEGYKLQYKEYESPNRTIIVIKPWNISSYMITGLTASRYYEVRMNMFTTGGDGPWSVPIVVHTEQDRLDLPGPIASSSDSLPWKIAVGGSALAVLLLVLLLIYIYLMRKSRNNERVDSKTKKSKRKSRKQGGYDFTDNVSRVSNESEGSTEGVYNVNTENDIDLSMFDNSHHANDAPQFSNLYVENPILPAAHEDSDDSHEAVRLATFIARPSPQPTPYLTGRRQLSASHVNPAYHPDEDDDVPMYAKVDDTARSKNTQPASEDKNIPVYAQVDFEAKERERLTREERKLEQMSDDMLI